MPDIKLATADVSAMKLGTTNVSKVYLGTSEVWPGGVPPTYTDVLLEPFNNLTAWTTAGSPSIVTGRTGTAAQTTGGTARVDYAIPTINQSDTLTIGFALRWTAGTTNPRQILQTYSDSNVTNHNRLIMNGANGQLSFTMGAAAIASSATGVIVLNTWHYVEVQVKLHDTTGSATVRVDGTSVITIPTADTKNGGTKTVYDTVRLLAGAAGNTNQYDDLYLTMGAGAPFKGSITIP